MKKHLRRLSREEFVETTTDSKKKEEQKQHDARTSFVSPREEEFLPARDDFHALKRALRAAAKAVVVDARRIVTLFSLSLSLQVKKFLMKATRKKRFFILSLSQGEEKCFLNET